MDTFVHSLLQRARTAQAEVASYTQEQVDSIAKMFAKTVFDNAEPLAKMAVEETGMGVYAHKVKKNQGKSRIIWNHIKHKKSVGVLREIPEEGLVEIANPMGVVGAVTPCTNPIVTPMCNAMYAVKGRNVVIIAPHPRAKKCAAYVGDLYRKNLKSMGFPEDIFQVIDEPSVDLTSQLMQAVDVVIATGGMGMVRAAYSSGKPSFGVGAGNVQCILDTDIDFNEAAVKILEGRAFDNGIICSGEQTVIVYQKDYDTAIDALVKAGAYYTEDLEEVNKIRNTVFPEGVMNKELVGKSAQDVACAAGIRIPENATVLIVKPAAYGKGEFFSKEKMCPVMSAYSYDSWENAVSIARANLLVEGAGHSVAIHSHNKQRLLYAGKHLPVSRLLVNQVCATMNGGAFANGLSPTTTLGCGSWGGNSISENLNYSHLLNVSRIAMVKPNGEQPSDEEIWGYSDFK